uniref:Apple domain-containing protein n=1 Tax=viral metagenome TaxID=1070528 RepID=A0A6C0IKE0_9ZZZZ
MSNTTNNENHNQNLNNTGSVILNLENISTEYNNVLTQYNQARSNYINYLNTMTETQDASGNTEDASGNSQYFVLKNTFYGQNYLVNPTKTNNIAGCKNKCSANSSCTGANFVNGSTCLLMKDVNGELSPKQSSNAIVPPEVYYLNTLKKLNQQLIHLNNKLTQQINKGEPIYDKQVQERQKQGEVLDKNYKSLLSERHKIEAQLQEFDDINEAQTNSTLIVNKNYAVYKYLLFVLVIIVLIIMSLPSGVSNQFIGQMGGKIIDNDYKHIIYGFIIFIVVLVIIIYVK